jgi:thiol-disulfide isomerase/thioredoxin
MTGSQFVGYPIIRFITGSVKLKCGTFAPFNVLNMVDKFLLYYIVLFTLLIVDTRAHPSIQEEGYDITVQVKNMKDTVGYLGYHFGNQKFITDTSKVDADGMMHFKGNDQLSDGIYFIYSPSVYFELICNEKKFRIDTDTLDFIRNMKISGSRENEIFNEFQRYMADKQQESKELSDQIQALDPQQDGDQIQNLRTDILKVRDEIEAYQVKLSQENQGTFTSRLLMAMQKPKANNTGDNDDKNAQFFYYKAHFFDNFDLSDPGLLKTPLYQPKLEEYTDKLTFKHPDSIKVACDYLLSLTEPNNETYRYVLVKLTNKYETSKIMGMEEIFVHLAEKYYLTGKAYWADSSLVAKFDKRVKEMKPNLIGNTAPEIILVDSMMRPIQLSKLNSRFIILYFYDPDCGHCKKITPKLSQLYQEIKNKNVEVLAACTVTDIDKWKKYIKSNDLSWINGIDPYYRSNFRADYDIKTTPMIYILNKDKEIIAKRLGVDQIKDFIDRMIKFEDS